MLLLFGCGGPSASLQPYEQNPFYWSYNGQPVLLIGGSAEDNLFQIPDIEEQLNLLQSVGGNYVRCTMSSRDEGNVWPFQRDPETGLYDLDEPNPEYWFRFSRFLRFTAQRDIFVQIEVWATFDYYRDVWDVNPFNPKNNVNYSAEESDLPVQVTTHPTRTENPFFWSIPAEHNNTVVLQYQEHFVNQLLSYSLKYGHVLYCMDNETSVTPEWGAYWASYIRERATEEGVSVQTTEMWDPWDLSHPMHDNTFDHPDLYTFVDISQNNHQQGQTHWDNAQTQRQRVIDSGDIRPLNNVKVYGADTGRFGSDRDGIERMWRNIFGGLAATRFHRPNSGLGLNEKAQANIRSLRKITDSVNVLQADPHNDLLSQRAENEAYCMADPGQSYAIFFPDGGDVWLDVSGVSQGETLTIQWLDILASEWQKPEKVPGKPRIRLQTPANGFWAVKIGTSQ